MKASFDATLLAPGLQAPGLTRSSAAPQAIDQMFQGFGASLAAASKAGSQANNANDNGSKSGLRENMSSGDETEPSAATNSSTGPSPASTQAVLPLQATPAQGTQQTNLIFSAVTSLTSNSPNIVESAPVELAADESGSPQSLSPNSILNPGLSGTGSSSSSTAVSMRSWRISGDTTSIKWSVPKGAGLTSAIAQPSVPKAILDLDAGAAPKPNVSAVVSVSSSSVPNQSGRAAAKSSSRSIPNSINTVLAETSQAPISSAVPNTVPQVPFNLDSLSALPISSNTGEDEAAPTKRSAVTADGSLQPAASDVARGMISSAGLDGGSSAAILMPSTNMPVQFLDVSPKASAATNWNSVHNAVASGSQISMSSTFPNPTVQTSSNQAPALRSALSGTGDTRASLIQSSVGGTENNAASVMQSSSASHDEVQNAAPDAAIDFDQKGSQNHFASAADFTPSKVASTEPWNTTVYTSAPAATSRGLSNLVTPTGALPTLNAGATGAVSPTETATAIQNPIQDIAVDPLQNLVPKAMLDSLVKSVLGASTSLASNESNHSAFKTSSAATPTAAVQAPLNSTPVSVLRSGLVAGVRAAVTSTFSATSAGHSTASSAASGQGATPTVLGVQATVTEKQAQRAVPALGLPVVEQAVASSLQSAPISRASGMADAIEKGVVSDSAGLKPHALSSSAQTGSQPSGQGTGSSADQSQGSTPSQVQSAASTQTGIANLPAHVAEMQKAEISSPVPVSQGFGTGSASVAKPVSNIAAALPAAPQGQPVINSAKLIQSMGQSEMRVGMQSNEFGNISISTSATRDLISAQISVDHGELAKALAVHLPEMQAKLGTNQAMDVRIDMNGSASGQGSGTYSSTANGSSDGSRGERQQSGGESSSNAVSAIDERQFSPAVATGIGLGGNTSRLDITV